jgi:hypothetical protein
VGRMQLHIGPVTASSRPFFLPLFTNVLEEVFPERSSHQASI